MEYKDNFEKEYIEYTNEIRDELRHLFYDNKLDECLELLNQLDPKYTRDPIRTIKREQAIELYNSGHKKEAIDILKQLIARNDRTPEDLLNQIKSIKRTKIILFLDSLFLIILSAVLGFFTIISSRLNEFIYICSHVILGFLTIISLVFGFIFLCKSLFKKYKIGGEIYDRKYLSLVEPPSGLDLIEIYEQTIGSKHNI